MTFEPGDWVVEKKTGMDPVRLDCVGTVYAQSLQESDVWLKFEVGQLRLAYPHQLRMGDFIKYLGKTSLETRAHVSSPRAGVCHARIFGTLHPVPIHDLSEWMLVARPGVSIIEGGILLNSSAVQGPIRRTECEECHGTGSVLLFMGPSPCSKGCRP